jgi:hypothetical protein
MDLRPIFPKPNSAPLWSQGGGSRRAPSRTRRLVSEAITGSSSRPRGDGSSPPTQSTTPRPWRTTEWPRCWQPIDRLGDHARRTEDQQHLDHQEWTGHDRLGHRSVGPARTGPLDDRRTRAIRRTLRNAASFRPARLLPAAVGPGRFVQLRLVVLPLPRSHARHPTRLARGSCYLRSSVRWNARAAMGLAERIAPYILTS